MIQVKFVGVRVEVPSNQPIVLLRESDSGGRYLPIFIGSPEATAIVYAYQGMETPRPMTHDLFVTVLGDFGVRLEQVAITALREGTFYAELLLRQGDEERRISARPSDAIALAVRLGDAVPIVVDDEVFDEAGVMFEEEQDEDQIEEFRAFLDEVTPEDFA
ncbi:MAG: bifunctional nuclease family protein [Acidimicrobiia bacterium]